MAQLHALIVLGTRPEAIKLAPVIAECRRRETQFRVTICFTGQHDELFWPVARYFGIAPDIELNCLVRGESLAQSAAKMLSALDDVLARAVPDCVVAQGDTTSVLVAALAAFYRRTPLVHVEAGLRTGNLAAPWPEEMNRRIATLATALHCAPTLRAVENLLAEGVPNEQIVMTGNTVIDALLTATERERDNARLWAEKHPMLGSRKVVLITGHRRENHGAGLREVCSAIVTLSERYPEAAFVFAVHLNPHASQPVIELLSGRENIYLLPPVSYPEFVWLMDRSTLIVTDSGGVQEEAPALGKPVLVTRETTERMEVVEAGAALLVGTNADKIVGEASKLLDGDANLPDAVRNVYGDGRAAWRVAEAILWRFSPE